MLALQIKHVDTEVAPNDAEYEPAEQAVHDVDPEADQVPALQA